MGRGWRLFVLGWALVLGGSLLAHAIQTSGGVRVSDVRFPGQAGLTMSGLLYVPPGASAERPAPAVLASHGYINSREMQSPFAIELSRRGFVVLAMDMTGHGYSQGATGEQDYGGPAALRYLRSLPFVDKDQIGLEGHSMGGSPVMAAATELPDGYRAVVLEGSTPGLLGAKGTATPTFPKNFALVFGRYDEFAPLMWQVPTGADVPASPRLAAIFGAPAPLQPGKVYGSVAEGTARVVYIPPVTHPWEHFSEPGVGHAVDWFQTTLKGEASPRDPAEQIWIWKEVGTLIAFGGCTVLILGAFQLALRLPAFASLERPGQAVRERRGGGWWLAFLLTAAIPAATYLPLMSLGQAVLPSRLLPQWVTNQLLVWALANAVITLGLGLALRPGRARFETQWLKSALAALISVGAGYLALVAADALFKVDFRFWVLGLKPLDGRHALHALVYLPFWTAFFLAAMRALTLNLPVKGEGEIVQLGWAKFAMSSGFIVLLAIEYGSLFATGRLATPADALNVIIAIQFVPLLAVVGAFGLFTWRRTNSYAPGAFMSALFITWYIVAGTAFHWSPHFRFPPAPPPAAAAQR
ncbi:alpha/beta hydrolase [Phenylobacterium sp.]|uniref:alpha/beta hydrolase n=1 Tax=Phenylobacterium sp. TaxID=1871053 RepID=UPI0035AEEC2E